MSKIKKVLTEDRGDAKYFFKAASVALDDQWALYDEIEGQTKYHNDADFKRQLVIISKEIRSLGEAFDKIIETMAKK